MYQKPQPDMPLFQGDIFSGSFVFPFMNEPPENLCVYRDGRVILATEVEDAWNDGASEAILIHAYRVKYVVVLSNTCDLSGDGDHLELATIGAILPLESIPAASRIHCTRNRMIRYHYLRADECGLPESFVHFGMISQIGLSHLEELRQTRVLTLPSPFRECLAHRFGEFVSRVALP